MTGNVLQQAGTEKLACIGAVQSKPEYAVLVPFHPDLRTGTRSMVAMTTKRVPTQEEADPLRGSYPAVMACVSRFDAEMAEVRPDAASIIQSAQAAGAQIRAGLIERKLTWAQASAQAQAINAETRSQLRQADAEWRGEMIEENNAEIAQRQRAAAAFSQVLLQEQAIQAAQRPVVTNCNSSFNNVTCVTR